MKRLSVSTLLLLSFSCSLKPQNWSSIGDFYQPPSIVWYDSTDDRLYVAGEFAWFDSSQVNGFGYVVGDTFISQGCGFQFDCGFISPWNGGTVRKVTGFARYNGDLYVTGYFEKAGGVFVNGIAKWAGGDWVPIGTGLSEEGHFGQGIGFGLEVMDNELYLYGGFDSINGIEAHGLAKFDGNSWSALFDMPRFNPSGINMIYDSEWFQNELYVGGNFSNGASITDIVKWNGVDWIPVGNGITGSFNSVHRLLKYKNKLIIAGGFNRIQNPGSIPGNGVTAWDGVSWDTLQGGVWYLASVGGVNDAKVYNEELYVAGWFDKAGETFCNHIAKWDGNEWCGPQDLFDNGILSFDFFNDTLFVTWPYGFINGDSNLHYLAKWTGGNIGDCQWPIEIEPETEIELKLFIFPNPTSSITNLQFHSPHPCSGIIEIFSILGESVLQIPVSIQAGENKIELNLETLSQGMYFIRLEAGEGVYFGKVVKE